MDDIASFDRFARVYDVVMWSADPATLVEGLELVDGSLDWVLDLGGGTGRAASAIESDVVVLDAARGMVETARDNGHDAVLGRVESLPIQSNVVDAVLIVDALHHFPSATSTLEAVYSVLRPGGVVVVREFDPETVRGRFLEFGEHLLGFDSRFYPSSTLADLVADSGFEPTILDEGFGYTVCGRKPMTETVADQHPDT